MVKNPLPPMVALALCGLLLPSAFAGDRSDIEGRAGTRSPHHPPPMRECGPDGSFLGLPEPPEEGAKRGERPPPPMLHLVGYVYDLDRSGDLGGRERGLLTDDFTVRCQVMHDRALDEFDLDGSGDLDEEERAEARRAHEQRRPPRPPPPPRAAERPSGPPPPLLDEFDDDGDGRLDAAEEAVMREQVRARIRAGDPPIPPPAGE